MVAGGGARQKHLLRFAHLPLDKPFPRLSSELEGKVTTNSVDMTKKEDLNATWVLGIYRDLVFLARILCMTRIFMLL